MKYLFLILAIWNTISSFSLGMKLLNNYNDGTAGMFLIILMFALMSWTVTFFTFKSN